MGAIYVNLSMFRNPRGALLKFAVFADVRLAQGLLGNMQCCHRAADQETKQNGEAEYEREDELVYIFVDITLLGHIHHI